VSWNRLNVSSLSIIKGIVMSKRSAVYVGAAALVLLAGCKPAPTLRTVIAQRTAISSELPKQPGKTLVAEAPFIWDGPVDFGGQIVVDGLSVVAYSYSDGIGDAVASWSAVHLYSLPSMNTHFFADFKQGNNGPVTEKADFGRIHNDCNDLGSEARTVALTAPQLVPTINWIEVGFTGGLFRCR
jgi:hypothetical protein